MTRDSPPSHVLDQDSRLLRGGKVIVGQRSGRVLRLTPDGASVLRGALAGDAVGCASPGERLLERLVGAGLIHPLPGPIEGAELGVTLVIPARDEAANIAGLIEALAPRAVEVIVVDDGSRDETARLAARAGATVVRHVTARGPGAARNTAMRVASTDLVAFLDADCLPPPEGWLDRLVPHLDPSGPVLVAPRIVGAGVRGPAGAVSSAIALHERGAGPLDMGPRASLVGLGHAVPFLPSAAMLASREALIEIGGFDESLRYGEDVDLVWRLNSTGRLCRYEPSVVVEHRSRSGLREFARQRFEYGRSAVALDRRHSGAVSPVQGDRTTTAAALALPFAGPLPLVCAALWNAGKMTGSGAPFTLRQAFGLTLGGNLSSARGICLVLGREWLPLTILAAFSRRLRRFALLGLLAVVTDEARRGPRRLPRSLALGLLDRLSYAAGIWTAAIAHGNARALMPGRRRGPARSPGSRSSGRS